MAAGDLTGMGQPLSELLRNPGVRESLLYAGKVNWDAHVKEHIEAKDWDAIEDDIEDFLCSATKYISFRIFSYKR